MTKGFKKHQTKEIGGMLVTQFSKLDHWLIGVFLFLTGEIPNADRLLP